MPRTIILGAGLTGLRAGVALAEAGHEVILVEKEADAGGIARSIDVDGFIFDHGPHGFHSRDEEMIADFRRFVGEGNYRQFAKRSRIFYNSNYFDYPLRMRDLALNMAPIQLAAAFFSFLYTKVDHAIRRPKAQNAEEYLVAQFGRNFYEAFFGPYTARVWGLSPRELDADFIEDRVPHVSLWSVLQQLFLPERKPRLTPSGRPIIHDVHQAYYPHLGIQVLSAGLAEAYLKQGGKLFFNTMPQCINTVDKAVTVQHGDGLQETLKFDHLITTIPLNGLMSLLHPALPEYVSTANLQLTYRPVVLTCVCIDMPQVVDVFWVYYAEGLCNRISEITHFSAQLAPEGKTGLCLEVSTSPEEMAKTSDGEYYQRCLAELRRLEIVDETRIEGYTVIREPNAYPIYHHGYRKTLRTLREHVVSRGIITAGRQGDFSYINMDQAMRAGLDAAQRVIEKEPTH
jgi:protoporphyrinogen oxidase